MNIDYFSPEELEQLRRARGVSAPAQGAGAAGVYSAQDINSAYNQTKAQLAAQRTAAPAASMPVGENLAPVATAEAANKPTFGQRLVSARNMVGRGLSLAARGVGGAQAVVGAYDAATDGVSANAVDNIANGVAGAISPAVGFAGNLLTSARDAVLGSIINSRTAGPNSVGPELQKQIDAAGGVDKLLAAQAASRQAQPAEQVVAQPAVSAPASGIAQDPSVTPLSGAAAAAGSEFIDGRGVPARGTGFIRNNTTGEVTQISSSPERPTSRRRLSTGEALAAFTGDYTKAALGMAMANREEKLKLRRAEVTSEMAKAQAALQQNKAKPVVGYGLDGDPIITDPTTRTAVKVTPTVLPSLASFVEAARKDTRNKKFTDAQLEAEYYRTYGQPGQIQ